MINLQNKWYLLPKLAAQVQQKEVAKAIADETNLNVEDVEMVLNQLQKVLSTDYTD